MSEVIRRRFTVTGQVQGVGFRPFVFRLAQDLGLIGTVQNTPDGVAIEVQGVAPSLEAFARDLESKLPPLARITGLTAGEVPVQARPRQDGFAILASTGGAGHSVLISPDAATCPECLAEIFDPADRRHLYPFTNCTNCGPRYTITRSIPYDRATTSMACFPMCEKCQAEYQDPGHRRFHAQPNCCPVCGPKLWLATPGSSGYPGQAQGLDAVRRAAVLLAEGRILAIKGLGGFHLVCDAAQARAVAELRSRKRRPDKPLAVMVPDLEAARLLAVVSPAEADVLAGRIRPIVLLAKARHSPLPREVAPDTGRIGIMLPYTPLHHVLLALYRERSRPDHPPALVMTSGNLSDEPIALGNREAAERLGGIADYLLLHDRDILVRADDSVVRVDPEDGGVSFLRRARGYVPGPVDLAGPGPVVLGLGPELKATVCLTKGGQAFVGQHLGDLENLETYAFQGEVAAHLESILEVEPLAVVRDLHPDYLSTRRAEELGSARGIPVLRLQHHAAHIHAVLAENQVEDTCLGLALDGTGLGEDRTIWGGELLLVEPREARHSRLGRLAHAMLPGGEAAAREPWRMARSYLFALGRMTPGSRPWPWLPDLETADRVVGRMLEKGLNCPLTSSAGRLFDAVAGLLGLAREVSYEGQAAMRLEDIQDPAETGRYPCPVLDNPGSPGMPGSDVDWILDTVELFAGAHDDWERGVEAGVISRRFHSGLAHGLAELAARAARATGIEMVALSGGVMQNQTLARELPRLIRARGLKPLVHQSLPPNDGCISLGQAAWGRLALARMNWLASSGQGE